MSRSENVDEAAAAARRRRFCSRAVHHSCIEGDEESPVDATRHHLRLLSESVRGVTPDAIRGGANEELRELIRALDQRRPANALVETNDLPPAA